MMKLPQLLTVQYHDITVGTLTMSPNKGHCIFEYSRDWLANGFSISPLELPLKSGLLVPQSHNFYGNFGIFEDSMPDGYGNYLLDRMLRGYGVVLSDLSPVERLSFVGTRGMGALTYIPEMRLNTPKDSSTLDKMQQDALDIFSEKDFSQVSTLYFRSGNSGGCRPKCLWSDEEGSWLVKFRHTYDPVDIGVKEYALLQKATQCGIVVPEAKLFEGKYLGTKRFDITHDGVRLHVATAAGLLCESIRMPMLDYRKLLRFTKYLTGSIEQTREMFRRMLFNYAVGNNDDHAKNFSFIYKDGIWCISPAYDITECRQANNGFHAALANGKESPTDEDFVVIASDAGLTKNQAVEIIREIREIVLRK